MELRTRTLNLVYLKNTFILTYDLDPIDLVDINEDNNSYNAPYYPLLTYKSSITAYLTITNGITQ